MAEKNEYLKIPEDIATEDQLWDYVEKIRLIWLPCHCGRKRGNG